MKLLLPSIPAPIPLPAKSIHEILTDPESLASLSEVELKTLLAPYIPLVRKAVLPEESVRKTGLEIRSLQAALASPDIQKALGSFNPPK